MSATIHIGARLQRLQARWGLDERDFPSAPVERPAGTTLTSCGGLLNKPSLLLSGWACEETILADGRRQILTLFLPGDLLGYSSCEGACAKARILSLTSVKIVAVSTSGDGRHNPAPMAAYCRAQEDARETRLINQIVRIGAMQAPESLAALLLELHDRLSQTGDAVDGKFLLPLTQETLASMLGMSAVHLNRSLQSLKKENLIHAEGMQMHILDIDKLTALAGVEYVI